MNPRLVEAFQRQMQGLVGVAPNPFLGRSHGAICDVLAFAESRADASWAVPRLRAVFAEANWALDAVKLQSFCQLVGELQFWMLSEARGVPLERISELDDAKTPDFGLAGRCEALRFEVKTLSVRDGAFALAAMAEESFESQVELRRQLSEGQRVASVVSEIASHGSVQRGQEHTQMCRHLIDKVRSNFKADQFTGAPTCLVVNLMLIDTYYTDPTELRPVTAGYPFDWSITTGGLWTVAFGDLQQRIHGTPDFEGKPAIEGRLERDGILVHPEHTEIAALLVLVHPLGDAPALYGLRRFKDEDRWTDPDEPAAVAMHALHGDAWNDDRDSNGYAFPARGAATAEDPDDSSSER